MLDNTKVLTSKRVFLIEIFFRKEEKTLTQQKTEEFLELVKTHGNLEVVQYFYQHITPNYHTYLGSGKLQEIREMMLHEKVDILIIGNILKPAQIFNINEYLRVGESGIEEEFGLQAWDKVDLLLKIFNLHARSTEAKLQVELASIKHMGPRIFGMGMELSRQGGGIGTSGIGETNTEIMRRHLQVRRLQIKKELKKYEQVRDIHRKARKKNRLPTIGLVGYTNSGKSSIMNALTNKGVLVANKLFATLGTDVGKLYIPSMKGKGTTLLINDTIGFMRDLPPHLIQAFKSTLEDSVEADILLHIIDITDPLLYNKIHIVDEILDSLGAEQERILVFNKIDKYNKEQRIINQQKCQVLAGKKDYLFISAITGEGLEEMKTLMLEKVKY